MKWPNTLSAIRHGESAYNILKKVKDTNKDYLEFRDAFENRHTEPERARKLAEKIMKLGLFTPSTGNHNTPLTSEGIRQAEVTGLHLPKLIGLPDVILVSPYDRTLGTLEGLTKGWPDLKNVETVQYDELREKEHGISEVYGDWRIAQTMHPELDDLYRLQGQYWFRYPGGENIPDVRGRMRTVMNTVVREYHEKDVLFVTHHLSILALRAHLERHTAEEFTRLDDFDKPVNCGVTVYRGNPDEGKDGKLLLHAYNQQLY